MKTEFLIEVLSKNTLKVKFKSFRKGRMANFNKILTRDKKPKKR